jgi:hypothetical protein
VSILIEDGDRELYAAAAAHFEPDDHRTDMRGGAEITYLEGETILTRMNNTFLYGWEAVVVAQGIHEDADECWARVRVTIWRKATTRTVTVTKLPNGDEQTAESHTEQLVPISREQYGSQKIKRSRSTGKPLDIGFDLKGAVTDGIKKTVSLFGVGLYLWNKEERAMIQALLKEMQQEQRAEQRAAQQQARNGNGNEPRPATPQNQTPPQEEAQGTGRRFARPSRPSTPPNADKPSDEPPVRPEDDVLVVNGIRMPEKFEQPFALMEEGKERNQCRAEQCGTVIDPNADYTVGGEPRKGGYVMKRAKEMAGTILCAPHAAAWNRALQKAKAPQAA